MFGLIAYLAAHQRALQIGSAAAAAVFLYLLRGSRPAGASPPAAPPLSWPPSWWPTAGREPTLGLEGYAIDGSGQDASISVDNVSEPGDWDF